MMLTKRQSNLLYSNFRAESSTGVVGCSPGWTNSVCHYILSKMREEGKGWISPAFDGHFTFLKMSRIKGTQTAKPMMELKPNQSDFALAP
ncbi:hypothetical protein A9F06_25770 [Klebsiella pneumoniae]|nr:hypothetical protein A9F06_25770 [Klebsiella pneumoniae]